MEMQHAPSPREPGVGSEVSKASVRPRLLTFPAMLNKRQGTQGHDADGSPLFPQDGDQFRAMLGSPLPPLYSPRFCQSSPRRTTVTSPAQPANHRANFSRGDVIDSITSAFDPSVALLRPLITPTMGGPNTPLDNPMNLHIGPVTTATITTPTPRMPGALNCLHAQPSNMYQPINPPPGQPRPVAASANTITGLREAGYDLREGGSDTGSGGMRMPVNTMPPMAVSCSEQLAAAALRGPARRIALREFLPCEGNAGGHGFGLTHAQMPGFGLSEMGFQPPFVFTGAPNGFGPAPHLGCGSDTATVCGSLYSSLGGPSNISAKLQVNVNDMLLAREGDGSLLPPAPPLNLGSGLDMSLDQPLCRNIDVFATPRSLLDTTETGAYGATVSSAGGGNARIVPTVRVGGSGGGDGSEAGVEGGQTRGLFRGPYAGTALPMVPLHYPSPSLPPPGMMMMMEMGNTGVNVPSPESLDQKPRPPGSYPSSNEESSVAIMGNMNVESGASRTTDTSGGVEHAYQRYPSAVATATGTAGAHVSGSFRNMLVPGTAGFVPMGFDRGRGVDRHGSAGAAGVGGQGAYRGVAETCPRASSTSLPVPPPHLGMMPVSNGGAFGPTLVQASRHREMLEASHSQAQVPISPDDTNHVPKPAFEHPHQQQQEQHTEQQNQQQQQQQEQLTGRGSGVLTVPTGCERPGGALPPRSGSGLVSGGLSAAATAPGGGAGGASTPSTLQRPHRTRTTTTGCNGSGVTNETTSTRCVAPMDFDGSVPEPEPSLDLSGPAKANAEVHRPNHGSVGVPPLAPSRARRTSESTSKSCRCKKSLCLKLYCDCFAEGQYCENCSCIACRNRPEHVDLVQQRRDDIAARDPQAFTRKIQVAPNGNGKHKRGCNCRKSHCLKKYCECYQGGVKCGVQCSCTECENMEVSGAGEAASGRVPGKRGNAASKAGGRSGGGAAGSRGGSRRSSATGMFDDYEPSPQVPSTSGCSDGPSTMPSQGTVPGSGLLHSEQPQQHAASIVAPGPAATTSNNFALSSVGDAAGGDGAAEPVTGSLPYITAHALAPGVTQLAGGIIRRSSSNGLSLSQLPPQVQRPAPQMTSPLSPQVLQQELQRQLSHQKQKHLQQHLHQNQGSPSLVYEASPQQHQQQQPKLFSSPSGAHEVPDPQLPPAHAQQQQNRHHHHPQQLNHELELSPQSTSEAHRGSSDAAAAGTSGVAGYVGEFPVINAQHHQRNERIRDEVTDAIAEQEEEEEEDGASRGEAHPALKRLEQEEARHMPLQLASGLSFTLTNCGREHTAFSCPPRSRLAEVDVHQHYPHYVGNGMLAPPLSAPSSAGATGHTGRVNVHVTDTADRVAAVTSMTAAAPASAHAASDANAGAEAAAAAMLPPPPPAPPLPVMRSLDHDTPGFTPTAQGLSLDVVSPPPLSLLTHLKSDSDFDEGVDVGSMGLSRHGMRYNPFLGGAMLAGPQSATARCASQRQRSAVRRNGTYCQHDMAGLDVSTVDFEDSPELADAMIAAFAGEASRARAGVGSDCGTGMAPATAARAMTTAAPQRDSSRQPLPANDASGGSGSGVDGGLLCSELLGTGLLDASNEMFLHGFEPNSIEAARAGFDSAGGGGTGEFFSPRQALPRQPGSRSLAFIPGQRPYAASPAGGEDVGLGVGPCQHMGFNVWAHHPLRRPFSHDPMLGPCAARAAGGGMVPCGGPPHLPPWSPQPSAADVLMGVSAAPEGLREAVPTSSPVATMAMPGVHTLVAPVRTSAGPVLWKRTAASMEAGDAHRPTLQQGGPITYGEDFRDARWVSPPPPPQQFTTDPSPYKRPRLTPGVTDSMYGSQYRSYRHTAFPSPGETDANPMPSAGGPQRPHDSSGVFERNLHELRKQEALAYMQGRLGVNPMSQQQQQQQLHPHYSQMPRYQYSQHQDQQLQHQHPQQQQQQQQIQVQQQIQAKYQQYQQHQQPQEHKEHRQHQQQHSPQEQHAQQQLYHPQQSHQHHQRQQQDSQPKQQHTQRPDSHHIKSSSATVGVVGSVNAAVTIPEAPQPAATGSVFPTVSGGAAPSAAASVNGLLSTTASPPVPSCTTMGDPSGRSQPSQHSLMQPVAIFAGTTAPQPLLQLPPKTAYGVGFDPGHKVAAATANGNDNGHAVAGATAGSRDASQMPPPSVRHVLQQQSHPTIAAASASAAAATISGAAIAVRPELGGHVGMHPVGHPGNSCGFMSFTDSAAGIYVNTLGASGTPMRVHLNGVMKLPAGSTFLLSPNTAARGM